MYAHFKFPPLINKLALVVRRHTVQRTCSAQTMTTWPSIARLCGIIPRIRMRHLLRFLFIPWLCRRTKGTISHNYRPSGTNMSAFRPQYVDGNVKGVLAFLLSQNTDDMTGPRHCITGAYKASGCALGVIFRMCTNGANHEQVANLIKLSNGHAEPAGVATMVNTEWGAFDYGPWMPFDHKVSQKSIKLDQPTIPGIRHQSIRKVPSRGCTSAKSRATFSTLVDAASHLILLGTKRRSV